MASFIKNFAENKPLTARILKNLAVAFMIWLTVLFIFAAVGGSDAEGITSFWATMAPYAYLLYIINLYWLIPLYEKTGRRWLYYTLHLLPLSLIVYIPFGVGYMDMIDRYVNFLMFFIWFCQLVVVVPFSWYAFRLHRDSIAEVVVLKKELKRSSADLQFLRSQINPHFLFNALNTLYGTSLQENAERTGEGIQKLGDMMRFMLHENQQDKILIGREINYLNDYIHLQKLRLAQSANISVDVKIDETPCPHSIAPMLLIPFVENAFKHGISLQKRSWVKIALLCDEDCLHFDVYNSIHRKTQEDPERENTGIGLENVKQRLQLIYPREHELVIRENQEEYFVHLTLNFEQ